MANRRIHWTPQRIEALKRAAHKVARPVPNQPGVYVLPGKRAKALIDKAWQDECLAMKVDPIKGRGKNAVHTQALKRGILVPARKTKGSSRAGQNVQERVYNGPEQSELNVEVPGVSYFRIPGHGRTLGLGDEVDVEIVGPSGVAVTKAVVTNAHVNGNGAAIQPLTDKQLAQEILAEFRRLNDSDTPLPQGALKLTVDVMDLCARVISQ